MFGNQISPPPLSAVQELKDLMGIITDHKKHSQLLSQIEDAMTASSDVVKVQATKAAELADLTQFLKEKESSLQKLEQDLAAKAKSVSSQLAGLSDRESAVAVGEKYLKAKQDAFESDKSAKEVLLSQREVAVAALESAAAKAKEEAHSLKRDYETKQAKLKAAMG